VDPGLNAVGKEKILNPSGTRTPTPRSFSLLAVAVPNALSLLLCHPRVVINVRK
jgi:hypothetical protein